MTRKQLPPDPERTQELIKMRDQMSRIRHKALAPLQRGFSGSRFPGQSVGPPDPIGDCKHTYLYNIAFQSIVVNIINKT